MRGGRMVMLACAVTLALLQILPATNAGPYLVDEKSIDRDYFKNPIEQPLRDEEMPVCLHRGDSCDHRPDDCCYNSSCRCNLWGTNCICRRDGLFRK